VEKVMVPIVNQSKRAALIFLTSALLVGLFVVVAICFFHYHGKTTYRRTQPNLPADVDAVVRDFRYDHDLTGGRHLRLEGNRVVRRGQKFLNVRSTIAKKTYFDDFSGLYAKGNNHIRFAAQEGEWDFQTGTPLILKNVRFLQINDSILKDLVVARIYMDRDVVVASGQTREIYRLDK
jgi:hypothetical protein